VGKQDRDSGKLIAKSLLKNSINLLENRLNPVQGEQTMRKALLISALILSIFSLVGCIVICCEEHRTAENEDVVCAPEE
jgi:hypothetical protein